MRLPSLFKKTKAENSMDLQDRIGDSFEVVRNALGTRGNSRIYQVVFPVTAPTQSIAHGFGNIPNGWAVIDKTGTSDIWRASWDATTITFSSFSAVDFTATIEVW